MYAYTVLNDSSQKDRTHNSNENSRIKSISGTHSPLAASNI